LKIRAVSILAIALVAGCSSKPVTETHYEYATKAVYEPAASADSYSVPPQGYQLVFAELLARHGSRGLTSPKYDHVSLAIWQKARSLNALTAEGEALGAEIQRMMDANKKLGYGNLSQRGMDEHRGIAERLVQRDKALFTDADDKRGILIEHSGRQRAKDSGLAFTRGLITANPELEQVISAPRAEPATLYFHKQADNENYQQYKDNDPKLRKTIDSLFYSERMKDIARQVLSRIYTQKFINQLAAGDFSFSRKDDGEIEEKVYNDVDAMVQLFNLYQIAAGMSAEAGDKEWQFKQYFNPAQTQWISYVMDAEDFYEKGPAFADNDITYAMARPLLQDFFSYIEAVKEGQSEYRLVARFAHAETVIPFATYLQVPGSDKPVSSGELYSRGNNPWRGEKVAPMAANIQWEVFASDNKQLLVRMLYNEQETHFKDACQPFSTNSYFYDFEELLRCYQ